MGLQKEIVIEKPEDVYNLLKDEMKDLKQEVFKVICLNSRNKVINVETVSIGTLNAAIVHPRDIFRVAFENNAASIVLVHNHPSGEKEPTDVDIESTKNLSGIAMMLGIKLFDHVVIGKNGFITLSEICL